MLGCNLPFRFLVYNFADVNDYKKFPARPLNKSSNAFQFFKARESINPTLHLTDSDPGTPLNEYLKKTKTLAFLLIHRDTILFEQYYQGYDTASIVPSFSIAKSITSALIGCAIEDGKIGSIDDLVEKYLPEWKGRGLSKVTIRHLLQMTSGTRFNESYYNPFGDAARYYYGRHLRNYVEKVKPENAPGTQFVYQSGNTQVLGSILDRVLKGTTITQYLQEKIWEPLQMEFDASWSIDKKRGGMEKTFCCINARARDFAKFGRLFLHQGQWNGRQIVPRDWCVQSVKPDRSAGGVPFYQYQWWVMENGIFRAEGILGQFIMVDPQTETIFVRLGSASGGVNWSRFGAQLMRAVGQKKSGKE